MKNARDDQKKSYDKPKVTRFPLRPEEAVLGFCKTTAGSGPSQPDACTFPSACTMPGS